ncbi:putative glycosyltransferase family 20 protein 1 [Elsinoe fawcettii]|nr:putative glycosyltransferase family 20 protein 1 [Elsinoe fawcettii]
MVAIVVSIFLPYTVNFHDYEFHTSRDNGRAETADDGLSYAGSDETTSEVGKQSYFHTLFNEEVEEEAAPISPLSTPRAIPAKGTAVANANAAADRTLTGGPPTRNQSSRNIKDLFTLQSTTFRQAGPYRIPDGTNVSNWISSGSIARPGNRVDSVMASSAAESSVRNLSFTDLRSSTTEDIINKPGHTRQGSLVYVKPKTPEAEVSTFDDSKWSVAPPVLTNGALVNAVLRSPEGKQLDKIWIGTLGRLEIDRITTDRRNEISLKFEQDSKCVILFISDEDAKNWYEHYCKLVLWPVLNYRIPDWPASKVYQDTCWDHYKRVNKVFADKVISSYKHGDSIWIHDYHLMAVPGFIRDKFPEAKIGFFMHTSFPSPDVWRTIPAREELLRGILGANMVIFQTEEYATHFLQCCNRYLTVDIREDGVQLEGRFINVATEPIRFTRECIDGRLVTNRSKVEQSIRDIKEGSDGRFLIIARDKLDNVRGIRQKLLAFELFMRDNPEVHGKVTFIQFASSTTELVERQTYLTDVISQLNSEFSRMENTCIDFWLQDMAFDHYLALLSSGDIMMTTPLREGMGMTPQEYIYCQDGSINNEKKHGVLILSENAGTSALLQGGDLTCNPWDIGGTAALIKKAYYMSAEEKESRYNKMRSAVMSSTGGKWLLAIQRRLDEAYTAQIARRPSKVPRLDQSSLVSSYSSGATRLFILDNENTLSTVPPSQLNYEELCAALTTLTTSRQNTVYVTSALDPPELEKLYKDVPNLGLIASNGCYVHHPYALNTDWEAAETTRFVSDWKQDIQEVLKSYMARMDGAVVYEDYCRLIIDYTDAKHPRAAQINISELCSFINCIYASQGLHASYSCDSPRHNSSKDHVPKKLLVIGSSKTNKRTAVEKICSDNAWDKCSYDWIMVAGDGPEDEPVMQWAHEMEAKELDVAERRRRASKAAEADIAEREEARARARAESKRLEKMPATAGASFSLSDDEDEVVNRLGKMRPLGDRILSAEDFGKSFHKKAKTTGPPLKVWSVSLGPANVETHAHSTLSGGPSALTVVLAKLAAAEKAANNEDDRIDQHGHDRDDNMPGDGNDGTLDDDAESSFSDRPFGKAYDDGHGDAGHGGDGSQAHEGGQQNFYMAPEYPVANAEQPVEYEPAAGAALANAYFERGGVNTGDGNNNSDNDADADSHHDSPPGSIMLTRRSPAISAAVPSPESFRMLSSLNPSTVANSDTAGFSSRDPSPPPAHYNPDHPINNPPGVTIMPDPHRNQNIHWSNRAPALPVPIHGEHLDRMYETEPNIVVSSSSHSTNRPVRSSSVRSTGSDSTVVSSALSEPQSDIPDNPNVRKGRDLPNIMKALEATHKNSYALHEGEDMYGDNFPALDSDNESEGTYRRNRKRELKEAAEKNHRREIKVARKAAREGITLQAFLERFNEKGKKSMVDHTKDGFHTLTSITEEPGLGSVSKLTDADLQPEYIGGPISALRHIATVQDLTSLLHTGRNFDHNKTSSLIPQVARISTGAKLAVTTSYETKEKIKSFLPRSQSSPHLSSVLHTTNYHAGATLGAVPSPHTGPITSAALKVAMAQAPRLFDEDYEHVNERAEVYRTLLGIPFTDDMNDYFGTESLFNLMRAREATHDYEAYIKQREEREEKAEQERREAVRKMLRGNTALHPVRVPKAPEREVTLDDSGSDEILFQFRPDVSDTHKQLFLTSLRQLKDLSCVKDDRLLVGGPSITDPIERSKGFEIALVSYHQDREALGAYQASREHHLVTEELFVPFKEDLCRFDFEVEGGDEWMCDFAGGRGMGDWA